MILCLYMHLVVFRGLVPVEAPLAQLRQRLSTQLGLATPSFGST